MLNIQGLTFNAQQYSTHDDSVPLIPKRKTSEQQMGGKQRGGEDRERRASFQELCGSI